MKITAFVVLCRKIVLILILVLLCLGYCLRREENKTEIEAMWRLFLWAVAKQDVAEAYSFFDKGSGSMTPDEFENSLWFDSRHPWYLSAANAPLQIVSIRPNLLLTKGVLFSSTSVYHFPMSKPDGLYTKVNVVKRGRDWKIAGEPNAVAN